MGILVRRSAVKRGSLPWFPHSSAEIFLASQAQRAVASHRFRTPRRRSPTRKQLGSNPSLGSTRPLRRCYAENAVWTALHLIREFFTRLLHSGAREISARHTVRSPHATANYKRVNAEPLLARGRALLPGRDASGAERCGGSRGGPVRAPFTPTRNSLSPIQSHRAHTQKMSNWLDVGLSRRSSGFESRPVLGTLGWGNLSRAQSYRAHTHRRCPLVGRWSDPPKERVRSPFSTFALCSLGHANFLRVHSRRAHTQMRCSSLGRAIG
jgi:hypothetical protein